MTTTAADVVVVIGLTDPKKPLDSILEIHAQLKFQLGGNMKRLYIISPFVSRVLASDLEDYIRLIADDPSRVFTHRHRALPPGVSISAQPVPVSPYRDELLVLQESDNKIAFICVDDFYATDVFTFASIVKPIRISNRFWMVVKRGERIDTKGLHEIPNIFTGVNSRPAAQIIMDMPQESRDAMRGFIANGIVCVRFYLRAGYHILQNNKSIHGAALHTGNPWISLLITAFQIVPSGIDASHWNEMIASAKFRKLVTMASIWSLSNYLSSEKYATAADLEEVMQTDDDYAKANRENAALLLTGGEAGEPFNDETLAWYHPLLWDRVFARFFS
jgi:hypothetical protein